MRIHLPTLLGATVVLSTLQQCLAGRGKHLNFLSIGDHGLRTQNLEKVVKEMERTKDELNAKFVVLGGDNFYSNGVDGVNDPLWESTFTDLFTEEAFPVPFYPIRGNHDYRSPTPDTELDYYKVHGDAGRWIFPSAYYKLSKELKDGTTVDLLFLDTIILALEEAKEKEVNLPPNVEEERVKQYEWIDKTLSESEADWLVVFGHHPIFSVGEHGDTASLVQELLPRLEMYNVDAYFSGHDHTLQHLQHLGHVEFFVNGNGAKLGTVGNVTEAARLLNAEVQYGFMSHKISGKEMRTAAIDLHGKVLFEHTQKPRRRAAMQAEEGVEGVVGGAQGHPQIDSIKKKGGGPVIVATKKGGDSHKLRRKHSIFSGRVHGSSNNSDKSKKPSSSFVLLAILGCAVVILLALVTIYKARAFTFSPRLYRHLSEQCLASRQDADTEDELESESEEREDRRKSEEGPYAFSMSEERQEKATAEEEEDDDLEMAAPLSSRSSCATVEAHS